jgi:hypothetical protein
MMGNRSLNKIERFYATGTSESKPLKVAALNLFHATTSPLFREMNFFTLRHSLDAERVEYGGRERYGKKTG